MKHPSLLLQRDVKGTKQHSLFPLHLVRRELTQQEHTVTMPRWPAPGTTSIEPEPPAQPDLTLQSRSRTPGCPCQAPCAQGRGCEPRMLLHPGWLASSSLPQVPCPPGAWGHGCSKATFALCQVCSWGSASCRSLGCIANLARAVCGKNTPHIIQKINLTHFAVLQSLWTQLAYTQGVSVPQLIKKLEYTPAANET